MNIDTIEWTEDEFRVNLVAALRAISQGGLSGPTGLEMLAIAVAGDGLSTPLGAAISSVAGAMSSVSEETASVSEAIFVQAQALERIATALERLATTTEFREERERQ